MESLAHMHTCEGSCLLLSWPAQYHSYGRRPITLEKIVLLHFTVLAYAVQTFSICVLTTLYYVLYVKTLHSLRTSNLANFCHLATGSR